MLKTPEELRQELGQAIRARRIGQGWSREESSDAPAWELSTWKRAGTQGPGLVQNLINAAVALRCEEGFGQLFPAPAASSLDEFLRRQAAATPKTRQRAPRRRPTP